MGAPKALLRTPDGTSWAAAAATVLAAGGCTEVVVTVGAAAGRVRASLPPQFGALAVPGWRAGVGAGLHRALGHALSTGADAVLVTLVDLPDVGAAHVRAVLRAAGQDGREALVRAGEPGRGGHPVLVGHRHLARALDLAASGAGLRELFTGEGVRWVPLDGSRRDVDVPADLPPGTTLPPGA